MKKIYLILLGVLSLSTMNAQTTEDSVKNVVNRLFEGMKSADPDMIKKSFADSAILQTIGRDKEGKTIIRTSKAIDFANSVSRLPAGAADERIQFETIKIDGPLALVWTPYVFYYNGNFSHCGVNSFHLIRLNGEWKIQYLIDTRRKQDCEISND